MFAHVDAERLRPLIHLNHRDVTLLGFSRAPIERPSAYKRRMGWQFPYARPTTKEPGSH
jgi:predicted dithiol-disulfide oxidoreductase (DUF899 family)